MAEQTILKISRLKPSILHISLNRPDSLNALSFGLLETLRAAFLDAKEDPTVKALLLTGEGKAFCAGANIKELGDLQSQTGADFARQGQYVFSILEQLGKPSLAAIHGFALGGGCELAMAATLRIAAENAFLGQPEIKLGVIPGFGGTQRLSRLVGKGRALELCLTGRKISAMEAQQWGLVNEVVPPDQLLTRAEALLDELTMMAPIAAQNILGAIHHGYNLSLDDALALEATYFGLCCGTQDKSEGVRAFLEKRSAVFSGS